MSESDFSRHQAWAKSRFLYKAKEVAFRINPNRGDSPVKRVVGDAILNELRFHYKYGHKSNDKIYLLNSEQRKNKDLLEKSIRRDANLYIANLHMARAARLSLGTEPSGTAVEMAKQAAKLVEDRGSTAQLGRVYWPGSHAFCVADYRPVPEFLPHKDIPKRVEDMFLDKYKGAWVIDPWMNISCRFDAYPARAKRRLERWSTKGKKIFFEDRPYDPMERVYLMRFTKGPLRFEEVPQALPPQGLPPLEKMPQALPPQTVLGEDDKQLAIAQALPLYGPI